MGPIRLVKCNTSLISPIIIYITGGLYGALLYAFCLAHRCYSNPEKTAKDNGEVFCLTVTGKDFLIINVKLTAGTVLTTPYFLPNLQMGPIG